MSKLDTWIELTGIYFCDEWKSTFVNSIKVDVDDKWVKSRKNSIENPIKEGKIDLEPMELFHGQVLDWNLQVIMFSVIHFLLLHNKNKH